MGAPKKRGLGRSLNVLLSSDTAQADEHDSPAQREIALELLQPGAHQPRRHFDEDGLADLASSIAAQGVIQPIVVREVGGGRFEIVAGERRWRAARQAGLQAIPAVVRTLDERGAMAVALVENIQRSDLNPLEEAEALHKLIAECQLTHEQVAEAVGRSRAAVSNLLRLMELESEVQVLVRERRLSLGHAKVLLGVQGEAQRTLAQRVADEQLSVRQTEALIRQPAAQPTQAGKRTAPGAAEAEMQALIGRQLGLKVRLRRNDSGQGRLTIDFRNAEELETLVRRLG